MRVFHLEKIQTLIFYDLQPSIKHKADWFNLAEELDKTCEWHSLHKFYITPLTFQFLL